MEAIEAIKILKEDYDIHYDIPDKMTTKGFQEIKYALQQAISALEIVKGLPNVTEIYGELIDIVNIGEHERDVGRREYLMKQAIKLSKRIRGE